MRRATFDETQIDGYTDEFQSTLSMRRATGWRCAAVKGPLISIHALHEESDDLARADRGDELVISIHALHEESDRRSSLLPTIPRNFNPRSP